MSRDFIKGMVDKAILGRAKELRRLVTSAFPSKPSKPKASEIPEGWEIWDGPNAQTIIELTGAKPPLIINRRDVSAPLGMWVRWVPYE